MLSPGIKDTEQNVSQYVPAVASSVGAAALRTAWGPVNTVMLIDATDTLVKQTGVPNSQTEVDFLVAKSYLAYSNQLMVSRVVGSDAKNAVATLDGLAYNTAIVVNNAEDFGHFVFPANVGAIGKYPGSYVNDYSIQIQNYAGIAQQEAVAKNYGRKIPKNAITVVDQGTTTRKASLNITEASVVGFDIRVGDWIMAQVDGSSTGAFPSKPYEQGGFLAKVFSVTHDAAGSRYTVILDTVITGTLGDILIFRNGFVPLSDTNQVRVQITNGMTAIETFTTPVENISEAVNAQSSVIWMAPLTADVIQFKPMHTLTLAGGSIGTTAGDAQYMKALELFKDKHQYMIDFVFVGGSAGVAAQRYAIDEIASYRRDCVAFVSPPYAAVVENRNKEADAIIAWRTAMGSSTYVFYDTGWKMMLNEYTGKNVWVPLCADMAGLCANVDEVADPWYSPAGYNRGAVKNVIKLAYNPSKEIERDILFSNGVNPVVTFTKKGTFLFGDKTGDATSSALDSIGVRRLMIVLKRSIGTYAESVLFELNDSITQNLFVNQVDRFLKNIQGRRGVSDYIVIADSRVNTPDVLDRQEFRARIGVKPVKSIRFIYLDFWITSQGSNFEEVIPDTGAN